MQHGWIGGRNDCWMVTDKRQCAIDSYDRRTAYLHERYFRVEGSKPVDNVQNLSHFSKTAASFRVKKEGSHEGRERRQTDGSGHQDR